MRLALLVSLALLTACGDDKPKTPCSPVGTPTIVTFVQRNDAGTLDELPAGGALRLVRPFQGGHVSFVAARVTGLCPDAVDVKGVLRDETGELGSDLRPRRLFVTGEDGSIEPQDPSYDTANVPLCPSCTGRNFLGQAATLELTLTDSSGRTVTGTLPVVPTCVESSGSSVADCTAECAQMVCN